MKIEEVDKKFLFKYQHGGVEWAGDLHAENWHDAQQKLRSMSYGEIIGELDSTFSANPATSIWVRLKCWMNNRNPALMGRDNCNEASNED